MCTPALGLSLGLSDLFSRLNTLKYRPIWGDGACVYEFFLAVRARTDGRLVDGVRAGGGQPGSSAAKGRWILVDHHVDVELSQGRAARQ
jgi:hypothetical protein